MSDIMELAAFAADCKHKQPPEARMFAANKLEVEYERREHRPDINMDRVRAVSPAWTPSLGGHLSGTVAFSTCITISPCEVQVDNW